jgi:hypothetical protein
MLKKIMLAASAVALMAIGAPTAHAAVVRSGCGFDSLSQDTATGQNTFTGGAYGYAIFDDQGTHTLRCYVTVDGVPAPGGSTTPGSGTGFVATAGPVTYTAADGASVDLCTEIDGVTVGCGAATLTQIPPQEVIDLLDSLEIGLVDPLVCPVLASLSPGVPGVIDIAPEGDVTLVGLGGFWDCPPYGNLFPPA